MRTPKYSVERNAQGHVGYITRDGRVFLILVAGATTNEENADEAVRLLNRKEATDGHVHKQ